ncbi:hypothetical protein Pelo_1839 [Pelomyxa schiedti]|nr:hypothetical protein Pelo_1839 [Pelomyxa schiedti]
MYTALHLACRKGDVAIVKQLLSCVGIGSHIKNMEGKTALESSTNEQVHQVFQDMCLRHDEASPPSFTPPKPQPQPATARPTTTTTMGSSKEVVPKALNEGGDTINNNNIRKQERDCWEIEARQMKNEITELKARVTQLEEENAKNLNLLHEERKQHEMQIKEMKRIYEERDTDNQQRFREHNSEMELQRLQEKTVSDMTAKNKELMELEAYIKTLEEESAKNLKSEVPSVKMPKSGAQVTELMRVQRASLSAPEIAEVDRLCDDVGDYPVVECLSRKLAITSALRSEPKMNNVHRACVGLFCLVVESCLSLLEIDRPSFSAIDKVLMTCAEIVFTNSGPDLTNNSNNNTPTTDDDVTGHISRCLANIAAAFPDHRNHTEPTTATSSS